MTPADAKKAAKQQQDADITTLPAAKTKKLTGAQMVLEALAEQGVDTIFGYPGGAVLPIYDALHQQDKIKHVLVRHEQGAGHADEDYER